MTDIMQQLRSSAVHNPNTGGLAVPIEKVEEILAGIALIDSRVLEMAVRDFRKAKCFMPVEDQIFANTTEKLLRDALAASPIPTAQDAQGGEQ